MITELPNLGPRSEAMLRQAGITTVRQLRQLGAVRAFLKVRSAGANPSLNLLWAIEGALTGRPWQRVAKEERLNLMLQLDAAGAVSNSTSSRSRRR